MRTQNPGLARRVEAPGRTAALPLERRAPQRTGPAKIKRVGKTRFVQEDS